MNKRLKVFTSFCMLGMLGSSFAAGDDIGSGQEFDGANLNEPEEVASEIEQTTDSLLQQLVNWFDVDGQQQ